MTIEKACRVLRRCGYELCQIPVVLWSWDDDHEYIGKPPLWWIWRETPDTEDDDEPWGQEVDEISEPDLMIFAEVLALIEERAQ